MLFEELLGSHVGVGHDFQAQKQAKYTEGDTTVIYPEAIWYVCLLVQIVFSLWQSLYEIMTQALSGKVHLWCNMELKELLLAVSNVNLSKANRSLKTTFVFDPIYRFLLNIKGKLQKTMTEDVTKNRNVGKNMQEKNKHNPKKAFLEEIFTVTSDRQVGQKPL